MEMTTGGIIVTDAIKYVQGKMDHLNNQEKKPLQDIKQRDNKAKEEDSREVTEEGENSQWSLLVVVENEPTIIRC
jgi:hypothetical protein